MNIPARLLLSSIVLLAMTGCARREEADPTADAAGAATSSAEAAASTEPPKVVATVRARIVLTPAAQAELAAQGDRILVEAIYAGDPSDGAEDQANELGLIELGKITRTLSGSEELEFDKSAIDSSRLPLIIGQPQLLLNVRSQKGLVACPMYWESVEVASRQLVEITCSLSAEAAG